MATPDTNDTEGLRRENEALRAELAAREERIDSLVDEVGQKGREVERLQEKMQLLLHRLYGRKSEKLHPGQLDLLPEEASPTDVPPHADEAPDDEDATEQPRKSSRHKKRAMKLEDLPRERVEHDVGPEDKVCACCGGEKKRIGEEVTEELEYIPASVFVKEHVRPKYACRACGDGVVIADLPPRIIDGGLPGPGLIAQIVVAKYGDHLPLNRQEAIFRRHGLELPRQTMCDWIRVAADLLQPIVMSMRRELLRRPVVQADETPVLMRIGPKRKGGHRAYIWVWLSPEEDLVLYDFHATRGQSVVESFLDGFEGEVLVVDGYAGYNPCEGRGVKRAGCFAHARRYALEAMGSNPREASELVALIRMLYLVEKRGRELELDADGLLELRRKESVPLLDDLRAAIDRMKAGALPQSALGKALEYLDRQWSHLVLFAEDGRLPIDNNACERMIRPVAVGRKNWLFAGSLEGGQRAAILYTLVQTCRRIDVDPFEYLRDVLGRVTTHPHRLVDELTPAGWKARRAAVDPAGA